MSMLNSEINREWKTKLFHHIIFFFLIGLSGSKYIPTKQSYNWLVWSLDLFYNSIFHHYYQEAWTCLTFRSLDLSECQTLIPKLIISAAVDVEIFPAIIIFIPISPLSVVGLLFNYADFTLLFFRICTRKSFQFIFCPGEKCFFD